jgi:hypothetical protein
MEIILRSTSQLDLISEWYDNLYLPVVDDRELVLKDRDKRMLFSDLRDLLAEQLADLLGGDSLPSQTGNAGKFLTTDGTLASWISAPFWTQDAEFTSTYIEGANTVLLQFTEQGLNTLVTTTSGSDYIATSTGSGRIGATDYSSSLSRNRSSAIVAYPNSIQVSFSTDIVDKSSILGLYSDADTFTLDAIKANGLPGSYITKRWLEQYVEDYVTGEIDLSNYYQIDTILNTTVNGVGSDPSYTVSANIIFDRFGFNTSTAEIRPDGGTGGGISVGKDIVILSVGNSIGESKEIEHGFTIVKDEIRIILDGGLTGFKGIGYLYSNPARLTNIISNSNPGTLVHKQWMVDYVAENSGGDPFDIDAVLGSTEATFLPVLKDTDGLLSISSTAVRGQFGGTSGVYYNSISGEFGLKSDLWSPDIAVDPTMIQMSLGTDGRPGIPLELLNSPLVEKVGINGDTMYGELFMAEGAAIDAEETAGSDVLNLGTTYANVINIGRVGATINLLGTLTGVGDVTLTGAQTLTNKTLTSARCNELLDTNGVALLTLLPIASAVNGWQLRNNVTGSAPRLDAIGGDTNIGLDIRTKGTGVMNMSASGGYTLGSVTGIIGLQLTSDNYVMQLSRNNNSNLTGYSSALHLRRTTGVLGVNGGSGIDFSLSNSAAANILAGNIRHLWTNATAGSETSRFEFHTALNNVTANRLTISSAGIVSDVAFECTVAAQGLILKSPDGTRYRATMNNGGTWNIAAA